MLIELTSRGTLSSKPEDRPAFRIYGDGRVFVRRPSYARLDPGDFEAYLSHADLQALLSLCVSKGLMKFEQKEVEKKRETAARKRLDTTGSVPMIADAASTVLTIRLARYAQTEGNEAVENLAKTIHWYALSDEASWYPEVEELVRFQEFVEILQSLRSATVETKKRGETTVWLPVESKKN